MQEINKDTVLCISLAGRPGNFGTRFHNFLYRDLGVNFLYKAFTTNDLEGAVQGIRALGVRGCAISMPFKEAVIPFLDELNPTAKGIMAVNTIVNEKGRLTGYNTDYIAVRELLIKNNVPNTASVAVWGSGGMAKAIVCALRELGFKNCVIIARNDVTGEALAKLYGYKTQKNFVGAFDVLINATPVGMHPNPDELSFPEETVKKAVFVFDAVLNPMETKLIKLGKSLNKKVISGFTITIIQAREQFKLYTGITPPDDMVEKAAEFARNV
ncbi:MAG: shikimate 5-dehydrogenase [Patescibacteria group bacterium]|nr:shikimate 5-dehydrogenase [Patescibacteria group bacterium]